MALSRITEAVASFTDLTIGDDLTLTDDLLMASDANIIKFGADADVTLTHVHNTGLLLNSTSVIQFNDASQNIGAPNATTLDINSTDEIELNATLVDVNANLDVSGTIVSGGTLTATTSIGIGSAVLTEAELEFLDGITAGTAAASKALILDGSTNITGIGTIGSGAITSSSTIQGTTITATTAFVPDASDGAALGTSSLEFSDLFLADAAVINLGADQDVTLTHVADTGILLNSSRKIQFGDSATFIQQSSDGVMRIDGEATINLNASSNVDVSNDIRLRSDASVLSFGADSDVTLTHVADTGILLNSTMAIQFNDASQFINAPSATVLDINATDEIELNATLVDVNVNINVSGTYTGGGLLTTGGNIVIPDAGNIGSASDTDAIAIASNGQVTFSQTLIGTALDISGDIDVDGTTNLDVVDIDGAVDMASTLQVDGALTVSGAFTSLGIDDNADAVAITIDSSENVMMGTTQAIANSDANDTTAGALFFGMSASKTGNGVHISSRRASPLVLNRMADDGSIVTLNKAGATVGAIQTFSDALQIGSYVGNDAFIQFVSSGIKPTNSAGTNRDNGIDLGASNARFKDLYLGGGAYIGGTGSANYLDDYEEGAWTPEFQNDGSTTYNNQLGRYVKIGQSVMAWFHIDVNSNSIGSNSLQLGGLPFTVINVNNEGIYGAVSTMHCNNWSNTNKPDNGLAPSSTTYVDLYKSQGTTGTSAVTGNDIGGGNILGCVMYRAT